MTRVFTVVAAVWLLGVACTQDPEAATRAAARARAERMLDALRAGRWNEAADFVSLDQPTRERMGVREESTREDARAPIASWLEALYGNVRPGFVHSVEIDPQDPARVLVTYTAGDLDTFRMRRVDGEWYYTLAWRPR